MKTKEQILAELEIPQDTKFAVRLWWASAVPVMVVGSSAWLGSF